MRLNAYGLAVDCRVALPGLAGVPARGDADLAVVAGPPPEGWQPAGPSIERRVDGRPFLVQRGANADVLMRWGADGAFHLAGRRLVAWAAAEPDARWRRVLLDSALATSALALGAEALHAGAAVVDGGAVAIAAGSGGGKSSLLAELVGAGHPLLADDVTVLDRELRAHPAPPVLALAGGRPAGSVAATALGRTLAELDGEAWVAVERAAAAALPLRALVLLEREPGAPAAACTPIEPSPLAVLPFLLESGRARERARARFERAADVAAGARLLRLRAPPDCPPARLAELVLGAVAA